MPKRQNQNSGDEPAGSANKRARNVPGNVLTTENPQPSCGLKNTLHGNVFQLKLLILFLIRGIAAGYQFELGTEIPGMGGKFDDLIFKFKKAKNINEASSTEEQIESYRFLQAKHKQNEETEKITAADLLNDNDGEFSLPKYFRSYFRDIIQGSKGCLVENVQFVHDCIICTNIGFDNEDNLRISGIELIRLDDDDIFLSFDNKVSARYKLKRTVQLCQKMAGWSEIHLLAQTLLDYATQNKKLTLKCVIFKSYHLALVKEKVINLERQPVTNEKKEKSEGEGSTLQYYGKLNKDFLDGTHLRENVKEFRQILSDFTFEKMKNKKTKDSDEVPESVFQEFWRNKSFELSESFGTKDDQSPDETKKSLDCAIRDEDITSFLNKLVFVVHTPNEVELDSILKSEVGKYYELHESDFQSDFILRNMLDWFKKKESTFMTSEERKSIFKEGEKKMKSLRVTAISIDYQKQLKKVLKFNEEAIGEMKEKLERLLTSPNRIGRIATPLPKRTAVKVIAKFKSAQPTTKILEEYFQCEDSYLMTSLKNLRNKFKSFKESLQSEISHHLLIVVGDVDYTIEDYRLLRDMIPNSDSFKITKRILVILDVNKNPFLSTSHRERDDYSSNNEEKDEMKFSHLSKTTKSVLMSLEILFQGQSETVTDLIGEKEDNMLDKVIGCFAIEELLHIAEEKLNEEKSIEIPSCDTPRFEQSLYIKRKMRFPFDGQFELGGKCKISSNGHIEWLVKKEERSGVWKKIKDEITNRASSTHQIVDDSDLMKEKSIVIISEVSGSGKSTILSYFYNEIKKMKPDHWVIRINLLDRSEEFMELDKVEHLEDAVDFLVNQVHVVDEKSSFSRSLLRNRLEKGDRIVFFFDGFDEINSSCQEKAIQLMNVITKEKLIQFYVTTRPHMLDKLQFEFSQLAYSLENFTEKDQINFLVSYWKKKLKLKDEYILLQFAKSLVKRVSQTLNDQEKTFFGIPLQSQILALNFQSNVSELIATGWTEQEEELLREEISNLLANQKFDCVSLFERLMKEKSRIFRDKAKATDNDIQKSAIESKIKAIEDHLTRLAIDTIVIDQKITTVLWPPQSFDRSDEDLADEEKDIVSIGLKFGLTIEIGDKIKFLHRTIAEYLFALFLYKGFHLDDKRHNKLLENEFIPELILEKILVKEEYEVVQVFFNGMFKKIIDDDENWRKIINTRHLPDRLKNFIDFFCNRLQPADDEIPNALQYSLENRNIKIFTFLCDCLDSTLNETQIETVMMKCFIRRNAFSSAFSFQYFRITESKVFERFIAYFKNNTREVLSNLQPFCFYCFLSEPIHRSKMYSDWNGKEQNKTVGILLQLIENVLSNNDKKRLRLEDDFDIRYENRKMFHIVLIPVLRFLMFHENYENLLIKLTRVLAEKMDDSDFAKLLKELFHLGKEHFISGRIEKVLATLRDLQKNQLLIEMRSTVFNIDPEVFQRIYLPVVESKDVTEMDLNMLMEPDSYGMTRLHRAAFYGDTIEVDKILEKLSQYQDKETKQGMAEIMIRDKNGFTPFYISAFRCQEEMYSKMLVFLKKQSPSCIKKQHFTCEFCRYRFVLRSLRDAIESEKIEIFQMILKAVKKELRPFEFIQVLSRPQKFCFEIYEDENRGKESILKLIKYTIPQYQYQHHTQKIKCSQLEFGNAIFKIALTRDDGVMDYTDLYDLIFRDGETEEILRYIDAEDLQGLLKLKGVANFMKPFLNNKYWLRSHKWENLIDPLWHFTKAQLLEFVDTITSKLENKIEMQQPEFSQIFKCLKKREVGDACLKKIFLLEDKTGFMIIQFSLREVKEMLTCLSEESQEEVIQKWNATPMCTLFSSTYLKLKNKSSTGEYWTNILMFYLEYGSKENLTGFVKIVTDLRKETCSVLSFILEQCGKHTTHEILKLVSEKEEQGILDPDAVKSMMIHEIDGKPLIIKLMFSGEDIDEWLGIFPKKIIEEIQGFLKSRAPKFIDQALSEPQTLDFEKDIQTLISFLNYSDGKQLEKFVHNITFIPNIDISKEQKKKNDTSSIWDETVRDHNIHFRSIDSPVIMIKFMKCVSEKLGSNAVKELILHKYYKEMPMIFYVAKEGGKKRKKLQEEMLNFLSAEDRKEIQRQIDQF